MSTVQSRSAGDALLQEYLDALLPPGPAELSPMLPVPETALRHRFWLVSAGGLELALPATEVQPIADGENTVAEGAVEAIDLGLVVARRAGSAQPSSRRAYLRVPAFPGRLLQVEQVRRIVDVEDRALRWRQAAQPRPWLVGMMDSPAAAVLSVHVLVRESESGEGSSL